MRPQNGQTELLGCCDRAQAPPWYSVITLTQRPFACVKAGRWYTSVSNRHVYCVRLAGLRDRHGRELSVYESMFVPGELALGDLAPD